MELNGRVAVVTGAASGIGLALSRRLVDEGMSVVMADVEADRLDPAVKELTGAGAPVTGVHCDVGDPEQVAELAATAFDTYGAVHLLCNNAGVATGRPNHKTKPMVWKWIVDVNVLGPAYAVSAFVPKMIEQGEGHVVNTASEAGLTSSPVLGPYHATKYAMVGLSESLALELDGTGVGVSCLCPELVDTLIFEATRNAPEWTGLRPPDHVPIEMIESWMGTTAMPPADVAARVVYAVRANRFWILTHDQTMDRVHRRNQDLEALRNPRSPR